METGWVLLANLIWGGGATVCFFRAWLAFLGLLMCLIGGLRRKTDVGAIFRIAHVQVVELLLFGLSLALLFVVCWRNLMLGRTPLETLVFLVAASAVLIRLAPQISGRMERLWKATNEPDE